MNLSVERSPQERMKTAGIVFVVTFALALILTFRREHARESPEVGVLISIGLALVAAFLVDRGVGRTIEGLRVARLGSKDVRLALLSESSSNRVAVNAFVAVEAGDLDRAVRIVDNFPKSKTLTSTEQLAKLRVQLARAEGDARRLLVEKILAWESGLGGVHGLELERYRAFVLADMLRDEAVKPGSIAQKLSSHDDEQVRAYATWLGIDAEPRARTNGATLARHHGHADLADRLLVTPND